MTIDTLDLKNKINDLELRIRTIERNQDSVFKEGTKSGATSLLSVPHHTHAFAAVNHNHTQEFLDLDFTILDNVTKNELNFVLDNLTANRALTIQDASGTIELTGHDHASFLLLDGSRAMTGALDMGAFAITNVGNVDGVDISAHAANSSAHHTRYTDAEALAAAPAETQGSIEALGFVTGAHTVNTDGWASASTVSQVEAEAGTATTDRKWTAERVKQAIVALGSSAVISDVAYDATSWDNNLDGASKNAIRDKINSHENDVSAHHTKYTDSEARDAVKDANVGGITLSDHVIFRDSTTGLQRVQLSNLEAVLRHNYLDGITASDHHVRYADSEAVDAIEAVAEAVAVSSDYFVFIDSGVLKKDAISDVLALTKTVNQVAVQGGIRMYNGSSMTSLGGSRSIKMPSSDSNCGIGFTFHIPSTWEDGEITIKLAYVCNSAYSVRWYVGCWDEGDVYTSVQYNILNNNSGYDFSASSPSSSVEIKTVSLTDVDILAGRHLAVVINSDASNGSNLHIIDLWIEQP